MTLNPWSQCRKLFREVHAVSLVIVMLCDVVRVVWLSAIVKVILQWYNFDYHIVWLSLGTPNKFYKFGEFCRILLFRMARCVEVFKYLHTCTQPTAKLKDTDDSCGVCTGWDIPSVGRLTNALYGLRCDVRNFLCYRWFEYVFVDARRKMLISYMCDRKIYKGCVTDIWVTPLRGWLRIWRATKQQTKKPHTHNRCLSMRTVLCRYVFQIISRTELMCFNLAMLRDVHNGDR